MSNQKLLRIDVSEHIKAINPNEPWMEKVRLDTAVSYQDAEVILVMFSSDYNYDIEVNIWLDSKGDFTNGDVRHRIKYWEFPLDKATEILGFQNNKDNFRILKEVAEKSVKEFLTPKNKAS